MLIESLTPISSHKEHGLAEREGVEMRVLGDLSLAPDSVQGAAARMTRATATLRNRRALLNICFSYTCALGWGRG